MVDAAVTRLAESITQLTLCQVITDEVDAATKLLDKACQKLQGILMSQPSGSQTSKLLYASCVNWAVSWIVVRSLPATKLAKHRKTYCSYRAQPKCQYVLWRTYWGGPFLRACFFLTLWGPKKGPSLSTCTWFVTRKAPCYLAVTWERRRTKILKGLCGVIGWFQVAAWVTFKIVL